MCLLVLEGYIYIDFNLRCLEKSMENEELK